MIRLDINCGNCASLLNRGDRYADNIYFLRYTHLRQSSTPLKGKRYFEVTFYSHTASHYWMLGISPTKFIHNSADYGKFPYPNGSVVLDSVYGAVSTTDVSTGVTSKLAKFLPDAYKDGITAGIAYDSNTGTASFYINGVKYQECPLVVPSVNGGKVVDMFPFIGVFYYSGHGTYYPVVAKLRVKKSDLLYTIPDGFYAWDDESSVYVEDNGKYFTRVDDLFQSTLRLSKLLGYTNTSPFSPHVKENLIGVDEAFFTSHPYSKQKFDSKGGIRAC